MSRSSLFKAYSLLLVVSLLVGTLFVSSGAKPAQAQTSLRALNFLRSISGNQTVGGIHNKEPNSNPLQYTNQLRTIIGQFPGLWSGDFLFAQADINNRQTMINEARNQWNAGALVNIMYHACAPTVGEPCAWDGGVVTHLSDAQWTQLITNGTALNNTWKARLDVIAPFLQTLKNNNVEVLFRPLHEMNQGVFWWGGRTGANGTRRLYEITHDYLTNTKGLTNLIWVWDVQDLSTNFIDYRPADNTWQVAALDVYNGDGFTQAKYNLILSVANNKPIAIGESQLIISPSQLNAQPRWSFFMTWAELTFTNSNAALQATHLSARVLTRNEMPGWGGGGTLPTPTRTNTPPPGATATPTPVGGGGGISPTAWYSLVNRASGKCVDARASGTANGTVIQQFTCNNGFAQQFQFQSLAGGFFRINNRNNSNQVLDVAGQSTADGGLIQLWASNGQTNQQWQAVTEAGGFFHFISRGSGRCLDVPGSSTADSVQLIQFTCNGTGAQSFSLRQQP